MRAKSAMLAAVSRLMSGHTIGKISVAWTVPMTWRPAALTPARNEKAVEVDALVTQRVALVDADHRRHQAAHVVLGGETGPGEGVTALQFFDPVSHGEAVVVQVQSDAVVLDRRRVLRQRPDPHDERAQRIETADDAEIAVLLET